MKHILAITVTDERRFVHSRIGIIHPKLSRQQDGKIKLAKWRVSLLAVNAQLISREQF